VLVRLAVALFFVSFAALAVAERIGVTVPVPLDVAIQHELSEKATPEELNKRTLAALERGDISEARSFADLAQSLGRPLPDGTMQKLLNEEGPTRSAIRGTGEFLSGFVTGSGEGLAGLTGAVISDFTVIGDLRDISREGSRMMMGEPYSRFLLGLSAVGIAATAATIASGGGGAPVRLGVSVLKAAWHGGTMTAGLAVGLGRMLTRAVNFTALGDIARGLDITSSRSLREAAIDVGKNVRPQVFAGVASDVAAVERTVGAADTVRLLRYVNSTEELAELPAFTTKFGARSRAVASFMGRATLRAFKTTVRVFDFLLDRLLGVLAWFGSLVFFMLLGLGKKGVRGLVRICPPHRKKKPALPQAVGPVTTA